MENMTSAPYQNSRFLHLFENKDHSGTYCLFHALTQQKLYGGAILRKVFQAFASPSDIEDIRTRLGAMYDKETVNRIISDLVEHNMVTPDSEADLNTYLNLYYSGANLYDIRHAYFIPVSDCNLRCRYCFIEDENKNRLPSGRMSLDTAYKSLDVFARLTCGQEDRISLTFYGGEPLLNKKVLLQCMHYVRALEQNGQFEKPVHMSLLTNGVLVDEELVNVVLETGTDVSVSIDGPEPLHDAARIDTANAGSFERAIAGFEQLKKAGIRPGVSCTLNKYNIHVIENVVEYISETLQPPGMGFNILLPTICKGNPLDVDPEYAARQLIKAFSLLREQGIYEDRVMRRVSPFTKPFFHFKDCMGVGGQIVIDPDGNIGPCQAFLGNPEYFPLNVETLHARLESIDSETIYNHPLFEEWRYRFPLNMEKCSDCIAISICGGGCPYASEVNHGSIWEIDERICYQAKIIQEWMIWDTYAHMSAQTIAA